MFLNRPEERKKYPRVYKDLKPKNKAELFTKKFFESPTKKNITNKQQATTNSEQIPDIKENLGK